jgi:hypothetical protein
VTSERRAAFVACASFERSLEVLRSVVSKSAGDGAAQTWISVQLRQNFAAGRPPAAFTLTTTDN